MVSHTCFLSPGKISSYFHLGLVVAPLIFISFHLCLHYFICCLFLRNFKFVSCASFSISLKSSIVSHLKGKTQTYFYLFYVFDVKLIFFVVVLAVLCEKYLFFFWLLPWHVTAFNPIDSLYQMSFKSEFSSPFLLVILSLQIIPITLRQKPNWVPASSILSRKLSWKVSDHFSKSLKSCSLSAEYRSYLACILRDSAVGLTFTF